MSTFYNKSKLLVGDRALSNLPHELKMRNLSKPMVISEKMEAYPPFYNAIKSAFDNDKIKLINVVVYKSNVASVEAINNYVEAYKVCGADSIIVVGREAAISVAKMVKLALEQGAKDVRTIDKIKNAKQSVPLFVVPVFFGSGDEGKGFARCYDNGTSYDFVSDSLMPDVIALDATMTFSPSTAIMASSVMYALASSLIAYTDKNSNIMTKTTAKASIELLCSTINNRDFRRRPTQFANSILTSTVVSGIALNQVKHDDLSIMSNEVSRHLKVPYSKVYSMLFPHYYEQIIDKNDLSFMEVLLPIIGEDRYVLTPLTKRAEQVYDEIRILIDSLDKVSDFKDNLSDFKMRRDDIKVIVDRLVERGIDRHLAEVVLERTF